MKLYNTLTRQLEDFQPQDPENVKIYTCGPTVYGYQHIGNYAAYVYWDLLVRTLQANGYKVNRVLNLTDVGHLASDADDGEDKLEKGARRENKPVWEIAKFYATDFLDNYRALKLIEPTQITKATDFIPQEIALVDALTVKGFTYETSDGIYFDTSKFPRYADFAHLDLANLKAGARVALSEEKRNPADFAVWKFIQPGEDHAMQWDYLGRPGYPGWHLECSTIIHDCLGEPIDIHTGGIDHIPVHHTNEIAQSEAAFDTQLSRFWLHCNFLTIDGQKISKSLGNTYTFIDLAERGFTQMDFKLWVLQGHYQSERNFTFEDLAAAKHRRLAWRNRIALSYQRNLPDSNPDLLAGLNNNLNSAKALAVIDATELSLADWQRVDELLGLGLLVDAPEPTPDDMQLIKERELARAAKDFTRADALRDQLAERNLTILDSPDGSIWQYIQ